MKKKIFDIIQIGDKSNIVSRAFDFLIVTAITLNILSLILETFEELAAIFPVLKVIEYVTTIFFLIEYILRIWTANYLYPDKKTGTAIVKFIFSFDGIVDLFTIIPVFFLSGFVAFRILRVIRIFHLFRINAQSDSFNVITQVLYDKRNQIISSLVIIIILMMASSLCMYSAEHEAQPDIFKNAFSGVWWAVSAMLTVGYGDICPVTALGRAMAILISFLGVGVVAIPTGIISAGFVEQYTRDSHSKPLEDISDLVEILITEEHDYNGKTVWEVNKMTGTEIHLVLRDGLTVVPTSGLGLKVGDVVITQK